MIKIILLCLLLTGCATQIKTVYVPVSQPCTPVNYKKMGDLPFFHLNKNSTYNDGMTACVQTANICRAYSDYVQGTH